jgi:F-type H+-transporting ATPase subunit b
MMQQLMLQQQRWQIGFAVASAVVAWALACPLFARADDEANKKQHPAKYKAHVHHQAKAFDLSQPADRAKLVEHLEKGEVEELELDKGKVNPLAIVADLGIWAIVIFVLLVFILRKAAWGPMLEGLQKREQSIKSAVEEAKIDREETRRVTAQFQAEMAAKMAAIPKIMEEARRDAEQLKEEMRAEGTKIVQAEKQRALREVSIAKDQALQELSVFSAQLATLISAKAIGRNLSEDDHRRLVDEALDDLAHR